MAYRPPLSLLFLVPLAVTGADQLAKHLITARLAVSESVPVIPGFFSLTLVHNRGAAFGMFSDAHHTLRTVFLVSVSVVAVILLAVFFLKSRPHDRMGRVAAVLVMGGAVGNLIDRLRFGQVVDFLDVYVGRYHWPAFNVADSAITIGIALFLWTAWRDRHGEPNPEPGVANEPGLAGPAEERRNTP